MSDADVVEGGEVFGVWQALADGIWIRSWGSVEEADGVALSIHGPGKGFQRFAASASIQLQRVARLVVTAVFMAARSPPGACLPKR